MNGTSNLSDDLTPRAKEVLDALLADLRVQTLASAKSRSVGGEVGVRDIVEAFEDQTRGPSRRSAYRNRRVERLLVVYAAVSVVLALGAALLPLFGKFDLNSSTTVFIASVSGALVAASLSLLLTLRFRSARDERLQEERRRGASGIAVFLDRWVKIESLLRLMAAQVLGSSAAERPLRQVLDQLQRAKAVGPEDVQEIRRLLERRNELVHTAPSSDVDLSSEIESASSSLRRLEEAYEANN